MSEVLLLGLLRSQIGRDRVQVAGGTVRQALEELARAFGAGRGKPLLSGDGLAQDLEVLVNGRHIAFLEGLETALKPDDQLTLFLSGVRGFPGG